MISSVRPTTSACSLLWLQLLIDLGLTQDDKAVRDAANWLLARPQSEHNPGMFFGHDALVAEQAQIVAQREQEILAAELDVSQRSLELRRIAGLEIGPRNIDVHATAALTVPETLVKTMSEYSHDPQVLYAYRDRLGDLIDRSGIAVANPWGDNFGVRGFSGGH